MAMARAFINPQNGYREELPEWPSAPVWVFFFGVIYLLLRGLWSHAAAWLIIASVGFAVNVGGGIIVVGLLSIFYAISISTIIEKNYLRRGWKPDEEKTMAPKPEEALPVDAASGISIKDRRNPWNNNAAYKKHR